ncbi:MAG: pilus assembly protein PilM [Candidatus Omnitrophota bacterium]
MSAQQKTVLICQITDTLIKAVMCLSRTSSKKEFTGVEADTISPYIDDKKLIEKLGQIFKRLGYNRNPVTVALPHLHATCRYLKVPTQVPQEIENIAQLQAARYLPYPANELITGYQVVATDKEGYSHLNLTIVHKTIIERYFNIFKELKVPQFNIALSSYGICNLYAHLVSERQSFEVIDIDSESVEVAMITNQKLLFSRSFKMNRQVPEWPDLFLEEIVRTQELYAKEISRELPAKIFVSGIENRLVEITKILKSRTSSIVETLSYRNKLIFAKNTGDKLSGSTYSYTSLLGLGLEDVVPSLNLLPPAIKVKERAFSQHKKYLRTAMLVIIICVLTAIAVIKDLHNKNTYLKKIKIELAKIVKEAKPLEEMEKKINLLNRRSQEKSVGLEMLYELYKAVPSDVALMSFGYDEEGKLSVRGQSQQLEPVFTLVAALEKAPTFGQFAIKVNYATKRKTQAGELLDFEIVGTKK